MDNKIEFELIVGLVRDVVGDDPAWQFQSLNGVFGPCMLYHNGNIMTNIGIKGDLMVFTCNRGRYIQVYVDLNIDTRDNIKEVLDHLVEYEDEPSRS